MRPAPPAELNDSQQRSVQRVLDMLDRLDNRLDAHFSAKRRHARRSFRGQATIRVAPGDGGPPADMAVWTRSISASGLSFICPNRIAEQMVLVGLEPKPGHTVWMSAEVVRRKEVAGEGFWEHGVAFRGRVED